MTVMHIAIPDDLKDAFERAYPGETIEQGVERLLRAAVDGRIGQSPAEVSAFMDRVRKLRDSSQPTTSEQIRALRDELRS